MKPSTKKLTIKDAILENTVTEEAKNGLNRIKEPEKAVERANLVHKTNDYAYIFKSFRTINTFSSDIYNGKINFKESNENQSNLLVEIMGIKKKKQDHKIQRKIRKKVFLKTHKHFLRVEKEFLMLLKAKYFQLKLEVQGFRTRYPSILISKY